MKVQGQKLSLRLIVSFFLDAKVEYSFPGPSKSVLVLALSRARASMSSVPFEIVVPLAIPKGHKTFVLS